MAEAPDLITVQRGAHMALGWFFINAKDAFVLAQDDVVVRTNPIWSSLTGFDAAATEGQSIWRFVDPDDLPRVQSAVKALPRLEQLEIEFRLATTGNAPFWTRTTFVRGEETWILAIVRDIRAERELRASETRFRGLVEATSDVVYRMSPDWKEMRQLDGRGFLSDTQDASTTWIDEYLLPEDQPHVQAVIDAAIASENTFQLEHRVRQDDGSTGWTFSRAHPIRGEDGRIVEWFGAATDVTERHRATEHLRLMIDELNHRVKNNLAMIQAAASQTFRYAKSLPEAEASLLARIAALAHASDLLTGDARVGRSLRGVIETAVGPQRPQNTHWLIDGPELELPPRSAHTLSLAMHELATNAVKHGAWSADGGRVDVTWSATRARAGRRLHLEWRELGGPPVEPPTRRGFGSRLIERGLAVEMGGAVEFRYEPAGLVCAVTAPISA